MLQRPQTLYLILALVCITLMGAFNIATYTPKDSKGEVGIAAKLTGLDFFVDSDEEDVQKEVSALNEAMDKRMEENKLSMLFTAGVIGLALLLIYIVYMIMKFKNLRLQLKMGRTLFLALLVLFVGLFFGADQGVDVLSEQLKSAYGSEPVEFQVNYSVGLFMPAAAAAFVWLANLGIKRDEKLLKSLDRLR